MTTTPTEMTADHGGKPTCTTCRLWSIKASLSSDDEPDAIGVCMSPDVQATVNPRWSEDQLVRVFGMDPRDAREVNDIRMRGRFGCIFHEPRKEKE